MLQANQKCSANAARARGSRHGLDREKQESHVRLGSKNGVMACSCCEPTSLDFAAFNTTRFNDSRGRSSSLIKSTRDLFVLVLS